MARSTKAPRKSAEKSDEESSDNNNQPNLIKFHVKLPNNEVSTIHLNAATAKDENTLCVLCASVHELPQIWHFGTPTLMYKGKALKDGDTYEQIGFEANNELEVVEGTPNFSGHTLRRHLNRVTTVVYADYHRGASNCYRSALLDIPLDKDSPREKIDYVKELTDSTNLITKTYNLGYWGIVGYKDLGYSSFNPPPPQEYNRGQLCYIELRTLEDNFFNITGSVKGFYVNNILGDRFDPSIHPKHPTIYPSLVTLLSDLSPGFHALLPQAHLNAMKVVTPVPMYPAKMWVDEAVPSTRCSLRSDLIGYLTGLFHYDDNLPGNFDFSANLAAVSINQALEGSESLKLSMSVFFHDHFARSAKRLFDKESCHLSFDDNVDYSYGTFRISVVKDANQWATASNRRRACILIHNALTDEDRISAVVTGLVRYRGKRAIGCSLPPVCLNINAMTVGHFRDQFYIEDQYLANLFGEQINYSLVFLPTKVTLRDGKTGEIYGHYTHKIITESSKISYASIGDYSTLPDPHFRNDGKVSPLMKKLGFPRKLRKNFTEFRYAALHRFVEYRSFTIFKIEQYIEQNPSLALHPDNTKQLADDCIKEIAVGSNHPFFSPIIDKYRKNLFGDAETLEEKFIREMISNKTVMRGVVAGVRKTSMSKIIEALKTFVPKGSTLPYFDVRFNPNAYESQPFLDNSNEESDKFNIAILGEFLVSVQIPLFLYMYYLDNGVIFDHEQLIEAWRQRCGINVRYLGVLIKGIEGIEELDTLRTLVFSEILARAAKHIFNTLIEPTDPYNINKAVSHYLNCLFGYVDYAGVYDKPETAIFSVNSESTFVLIVDDIAMAYGYKINAKTMAEFFSTTGVDKLALLRRICNITGITMKLKDYVFTDDTPFVLDDVIDVVPVIKSFDYELIGTRNGFNKILERQSLERFHEADFIGEQLYKEVENFGSNLKDVGFWGQHLTKSSFRRKVICDFIHQFKATESIERTLGVCHFRTVFSYFIFAVTAAVHNVPNTALKLCLRVHRLVRLLAGGDGLFIIHVEQLIAFLLTAIGHTEVVPVLDLYVTEHNKKIHGFYGQIAPMSALLYMWHNEYCKALELYRGILSRTDLSKDDRALYENYLKICLTDAVTQKRAFKEGRVAKNEEFMSFIKIGHPLISFRGMLSMVVMNMIPEPFEAPIIVNPTDYYYVVHGIEELQKKKNPITRKPRLFE